MENKFARLHTNQKILIYEMLKRGILVDVLNYDLELIKASLGSHDELIYDRDSSIMPYNVSVLAGDKGITKKILSDNNISVTIGEVFSASYEDYILKVFSLFKGPVVLKPVFGSHGYNVYLNLTTKEEVSASLKKIVDSVGLKTQVLIEEYFDAKEYRVFITKNNDYAVLHRDPAHVYGDGINNIKDLITNENYRRMNPRTNALCDILVDDELYKYINTKGLTMESIPLKDEKVYLRPNSNVAMGGLCIDYTDKVHPSVIEIGKQVLKAFPGLPYVGIDFMTNSIDQKQTDETYRIIEINTVPGIHMHYRPAVGESQNVAQYMVDLIFPESRDINGNQKSIRKLWVIL